jgi:hypothetical protein
LVWEAYYQGKVPHAEHLCGSFWWKDVLKQVDNFRGVAKVQHGRGDTLLFWSDNWEIQSSSQPMCARFPRLFSFVINENCSVAQVYQAQEMGNLFHRPLSLQAYQELVELQDIMQSNPLSESKDVWKYCWGEKYTAKSFYTHIHSHIQVPRIYKWLWNSCCIMKTKVFAWLLLSDRLNTRDLLQRRHWKVTEDTHCVLCPGKVYEDRIHLFFECNFSVRVWNYLQIEWKPHDYLQEVLDQARRSFGRPFFMEVLMTACWNIWILRNGKIFRNEKCSFTKWRSKFIQDITLLQYRTKAKHKDSLLAWIRSLP